MVIIAEGILLDNSAQQAPRGAAAGIFELARKGYLTLELTDVGVTLARTNTPTDTSLALEQRLLLTAVSPQVTLNAPHQVPVAQTAAALACLLLRRQGLARTLSPRRLMRRIELSLCIPLIIWAIVISAVFPDVAYAAIALVVACTLGWKYNNGVRTIKSRALFYTKKGKTKQKRLEALRDQLAKKKPGQEDLLNYELIWTTCGPLTHAPIKAPHWFKGEWPATAKERSTLLRTMFNAIAAGLNQRPGKKGRFELNHELLKEAELYQFIGSIKDASEIFYGLATDTEIDLRPDS